MAAPTANPTKPSPPEDRRCALCTQPSHLTFHHLVPKDLHGRRTIRERYPPEVLRTHGIWICRTCHDFLHATYDEKTLGEQFHSLDALRADPAVARHIAWAAKQKRRV